MRFTDAKVRNLKPLGKRYIEWEGGGFGVRVSSEGRKTFVFMYRFGSKSRMMSLGAYPATTLAQAHKAYGDAAEKLERGIDPGAEKVEARRVHKEAHTISALVDDFIEKYAKPRKRTWAEDKRILDREVVTRWGNRKAKDIKRRDVIAMLDEIEGRGSKIMANRTLAVTRKMFNWAIGKDIVEISPCLQVKAPSKENPKDRFLGAEEVKTFWENLNNAEMPATAKLALKLILATGQRPGEVTGMKWTEIDDNWWELSGARTKNNLPHRVFLSSLAKSVLDEAAKLNPNAEYVFPSPRKHQSYDPAALPRQVRNNIKSFGLSAFTPHDLRRTVATHMHEIGIGSDVVAKVLNHKDKGVTATVYNQYQYDREKQHALDSWALRLNEIISGSDSKIVRFTK